MTNINSLQNLIIEGVHDRKGRNVTLVDMSEIESAAASHFIIAEGTSTMQVGAIADSVREYVQEKSSVKPTN